VERRGETWREEWLEVERRKKRKNRKKRTKEAKEAKEAREEWCCQYVLTFWFPIVGTRGKQGLFIASHVTEHRAADAWDGRGDVVHVQNTAGRVAVVPVEERERESRGKKGEEGGKRGRSEK